MEWEVKLQGLRLEKTTAQGQLRQAMVRVVQHVSGGGGWVVGQKWC